MEKRKKVTISWSGGKDSAFALYRILLSREVEVVHLHTVFNSENKRVGLHGIHESLIEQQAKDLGFPLEKLYLKESDDHQSYKDLISSAYAKWKSCGIEAVVFGDIYLEDLRAFREDIASQSGVEAIFPLWSIATDFVVNDFINAGFKTLLCSGNASLLPASYAGLTFDDNLIKSLPAKVDPCGENGEFHTFVVDGPIFKVPIAVQLMETVERGYKYKVKDDDGLKEVETKFWFADLQLI